jgi:hypothetical protein
VGIGNPDGEAISEKRQNHSHRATFHALPDEETWQPLHASVAGIDFSFRDILCLKAVVLVKRHLNARRKAFHG